MTPENLVKSKERVTAHGEVFTAACEVNAMLDLVQGQFDRMDSRFLEPACGTGNFLVAVLRRKLAVATRKFGKRQPAWELNAVVAVSSLYGVDILPDNVEECRTRLLGVFADLYNKQFPAAESTAACLRAVRHLLTQNILWGDALSMRTPDAAATPITFAEWSVVPGRRIKRRDYTLAHLLSAQAMQDTPMFSDLKTPAVFPKLAGESAPVPYLQLGAADEALPLFSTANAAPPAPAPGL